MYTVGVQQIGRIFKDKGENEWKEDGARSNTNTYLNEQVYKTNQVHQIKQ